MKLPSVGYVGKVGGMVGITRINNEISKSMDPFFVLPNYIDYVKLI